jgi:transposase-like protein
MSNQRYSPEFKDEAVRQIIEGGHSTSEVAARLGVSANSFYKWVNESPRVLRRVFALTQAAIA